MHHSPLLHKVRVVSSWGRLKTVVMHLSWCPIFFVVVVTGVQGLLDPRTRRECQVCTRKEGFVFVLSEVGPDGQGIEGYCTPHHSFTQTGCLSGKSLFCREEDCGGRHAVVSSFLMDLLCGGEVRSDVGSKIVCRDSKLSMLLGRPRPKRGRDAVSDERAIRNFLTEMEGEVYGPCDRCLVEERVFVVSNTTTGFVPSCLSVEEVKKVIPWPAEMSRLVCAPQMCGTPTLSRPFGETMRWCAIGLEIVPLLKRGDRLAGWSTAPYLN